MYPPEILRLMLGDETLKEIGYSPARGSILTLASGERAGNQREERAVYECIPID
jgi:hypothetical protein